MVIKSIYDRRHFSISSQAQYSGGRGLEKMTSYFSAAGGDYFYTLFEPLFLKGKFYYIYFL